MAKTLNSPNGDSYKDVENTIHKLCHKFHNKYHVEYEELLAEANLAYCCAYQSYNPNKGTKFNSWVYTIVWVSLSDMIRKASQKSERLHKVDAELGEFTAKEQPQKFSRKDFLNKLSMESGVVIRFVLDPPPDLSIEFRSAAKDGQLANRLTRFLREMGWKATDIKRVFTEINEALMRLD